MTEPELDMALAALLTTAKSVAPDLPEDLLRKAFAIQKRHQFDRPDHRADSVSEMQALVEGFIDAEGGAS